MGTYHMHVSSIKILYHIKNFIPSNWNFAYVLQLQKRQNLNFWDLYLLCLLLLCLGFAGPWLRSFCRYDVCTFISIYLYLLYTNACIYLSIYLHIWKEKKIIFALITECLLHFAGLEPHFHSLRTSWHQHERKKPMVSALHSSILIIS